MHSRVRARVRVKVRVDARVHFRLVCSVELKLTAVWLVTVRVRTNQRVTIGV